MCLCVDTCGRSLTWTPYCPITSSLAVRGVEGVGRDAGRRVWVPSALWYPQEDHGAVPGSNHCPTLPYSNALDTLSLQRGQLPAVKAPVQPGGPRALPSWHGP